MIWGSILDCLWSDDPVWKFVCTFVNATATYIAPWMTQSRLCTCHLNHDSSKSTSRRVQVAAIAGIQPASNSTTHWLSNLRQYRCKYQPWYQYACQWTSKLESILKRKRKSSKKRKRKMRERRNRENWFNKKRESNRDKEIEWINGSIV